MQGRRAIAGEVRTQGMVGSRARRPMRRHWLSSAITERARFLALGSSGIDATPTGRYRERQKVNGLSMAIHSFSVSRTCPRLLQSHQFRFPMITATPKERAYSVLATGIVPAARSGARAGNRCGASFRSILVVISLPFVVVGTGSPYPVCRSSAPDEGVYSSHEQFGSDLTNTIRTRGQEGLNQETA